MTPRAPLLVLVLVALAAAMGGCRSGTRSSPEPGPVPRAAGRAAVPALRYRVWVVEGALEASHGGGKWIEELYFPAQGIVANVVWETTMRTDGKGQFAWDETRAAHAFHGEMRNKSSPEWFGTPVEQPTERVEVPNAVAQRIFALADLTRRREQECTSLGDDLDKAGILHKREDERRQ